MGVYIRGMEMPKSCYACMFFAQTDYWNKKDEADILSHCKRTGEKTWESVNGYLPNCPLVPVPAHGRLIDADTLAKRIKDEGRNQAEYYADRYAPVVMAYGDCYGKVQSAPTIIEAEEGK